MESLKAKNVARKVLPFLTKKELPVTPNNYRIWFEYFMGENEEIKTHLDELLESDTKFTPELNDQLYEKFFVRDFEKESSERTLKEIDVAEDTSAKASDLIMSTIKDLLESSEITSEYGQKLKSYTQDVGMAQKIEDVKNLLTSMVRDTHEAEHTNVKIQKKLKNSSVELKKINLDLTVARKEARTDKLTGLYNRRMFDELLKNHIELMENEKKDCSIIMLDIDFFKKFNDLYGHPVGDKLLKAVSVEIVEKVSDNGLICRYGGEEFIVLCPDIDVGKAFELAECIRYGIRDEVEFTVKSSPVSVTVSLGVSQIRPGDGKTSLIERVDAAMYRAKKSGRDNTKTDRDLDAKVPGN